MNTPLWSKRISRDAKFLLSRLLRKSSEKRFGVRDALQHSWFSLKVEALHEDIMEEVVDSFGHFQSLNMFQKAAVTALAWRASDEDTARLRSVFQALDKNGNGSITVDELRRAIQKSGISIPPDLEALANHGDTDGSSTIEYTEFLAATLDKRTAIREEVVWDAFRVFDLDGNGRITKDELLKVLAGRSGDKIR